MEKPILENDNGCGQGFHPSWAEHPCSPVAARFNYNYSHSTRISALGGTRYYLSHCFTNGRHTLSFETWFKDQAWGHHKLKSRTSCGCGSSHQHTVFTMSELEKHLAYKKRKHRLQ